MIGDGDDFCFPLNPLACPSITFGTFPHAFEEEGGGNGSSFSYAVSHHIDSHIASMVEERGAVENHY